MERNFKTEFQEIKILGSGAFSTVFEAIFIKNSEAFAIKKVPIKTEDNNQAMREIKFLRTLESDYIVYFNDYWIENNYYIPFKAEYNIDYRSPIFDPLRTKLMHIQMELCSMTLRNVIKAYDHKGENKVSKYEYSEACEILMQMLYGIDYLHTHNPPVIHRDLKPENLLILKIENEKKIKLSDFGLSVFHSFIDQSHTKYIGTKMYRAPEINSKSYDTKADIYSLGMIITELFNICINKDFKNYDETLNSKYKSLMEIAINCLNARPQQRPSCNDIIQSSHLWYLF